MIIDLDFDGVEPAKPFEPLPSGVYVLTIDNAEIVDSKNEGVAPNMKLVFNVEGHDGNKIWHQLNLGQKSKPYTLQFLYGIFGDSIPQPLHLSTEEDRAEFCAGIIGMNCEAVVEKKLRNNIPEGEPAKYTNTITSFNAK